MSLSDALLPAPSPAQRWNPHIGRATSHIRALAAALGLSLLPLLPPACSPEAPPAGPGEPGLPAGGGGAEPALDPAAALKLAELRRTFEPISPTATSDKVREWRDAKRRHLEELEQGPATLAPAALEAFAREPAAPDEWRVALLSIAAHTDRERARPLLEKLCLEYDSQATLGVRNEAVRLLALTSPAAAAKLLEPLVLDPRPNVTYPPKEQMLRHWTQAARAIRRPVDETLARIATDIAQYPDTRYVAVEELSTERESRLGRRALETVLVESGSDGMLRRKAAQSLRTILPQAELCALLERVGALETDQAFALFLADMLTKNCP